MSNIVPFNPQGQAPAALQQHLANIGGLAPSALSQGVGAGYANVSFKGKVFQIRYNGQVTHLLDPTTKAPMQYFDVIIVDAKRELSKTYYAGTYTEGDNQAPDCSSEDGVHPTAPAGKQVIAATCAACPFNVFGSKISQDNKATNSKACQDTRKVAIVPSFNIANENFGGSMLLRVPPDSLKPLAQYARSLEAQGAPHYAVVTRITFDYTVSHPRLAFQAVRWLSEQELQEVLALQNNQNTREIVQGVAPPQAALPAPAVAAPIAGQPPVQPVNYAPPPVAAQAPQAYPPPQPAHDPYAQPPGMQAYPPPQAAPVQTLSPPAPPPQGYAPPMQAPGVPSSPMSVGQSFPQQPPQQAAPLQPPPGYDAPAAMFAPAPQAPVQQPQPAYHAPQMTAPGAPVQQPPPAQQTGALPQAVISEVDRLIG